MLTHTTETENPVSAVPLVVPETRPVDEARSPAASLPWPLRMLRDGWLIVGLSGLLIVTLELGYRAQGSIRRWLGGQTSQEAFFDGKPPWMDRLIAEEQESANLRWKPYVYFRRQPFHGAFLNVDSLGHRRTVQDAAPAPARQVFFFGGSTMFGTFQRDSGTIPSAVARDLRGRGVSDAWLTNFGETGYVLTQEVIELLLQLRSGARPSAVVFYDGINDVYALWQNGEPGLPQNEFNREREFRLGRRVFNWRHDAATEAGAMAALAQASLSRMELVNRLLRQAGASQPRAAGDATPTPDSLAAMLVQSYAATARLVGALAKAYGFHALLVWQPTLHGTTKPLSPSESLIVQRILNDPAESRIRQVHQRTPVLLDSAMADVSDVAFLNLATVFATDSGQIFADQIGHTNERANGPIASAISSKLAEMLRQPGATRR